VLSADNTKTVIEANLGSLNQRIETACMKVRRSVQEITLVAVTKTVPTGKIIAGIEAGIKIIGENRVQEAQEKHSVIGNKADWHLIGHLQTNKVKKALEIFSMIQSVDSLHLAQEIERRKVGISKKIPILIEVNTSCEATKYGVQATQLNDLVKDILNLPHITLEGLMTIGPGLAVEDKERSRPCFRILYELKQKVEAEFGIKLPYLSMGMSSDFEVGIEEGSNMIRVGTAIFGPRV
jgi:PLP dependent protein